MRKLKKGALLVLLFEVAGFVLSLLIVKLLMKHFLPDLSLELPDLLPYGLPRY